MRSTLRWLRRPLAAIIAAWFVLVMVEPSALHSCPVHGDHGAVLSPAPQSRGGADQLAAAGLHTGHDAGVPTPEHDHAGCTCPGDCTAPGTAAAVPVAPVLPSAAPASRAPTENHALVFRALPRAQFVLPFANGPPRLPRLA